MTSAVTLLLVEDEPALAEILAKQLRRAGYVVDVRGSAASAEEYLHAQPSACTLAVVDLTLPDAAGGDFLSRILALAPSVGLVVSSGLPFDPSRLPTARPNQVCFLQKPFRVSALLEALAGVTVHAQGQGG